MADEIHEGMMSDAEIDALIAQAPPTPPDAPAAPVIEATPAPIAGEPDPTRQPAAAPAQAPDADAGEPGAAAPASPAPGDVVPKRVYTKHMTPLQQETVRIITQNPDIDPLEAATKARANLGFAPVEVNGHNGHAPSPNGNGAHAPDGGDPPAPAAPSYDTLPAMEARIDEIDTRLKEASESDGVGTTFNAEINQLLAERQQLVAEHALEKRAAAFRARQEENEVQRLNAESVEAATAAYADLAVEGSALQKACIDRYHEVNTLAKAVEADPSLLNNPDVNLRMSQFNHPNFAMMLADEVAGELGIPRSTAAKSGAAPSAASPTPQGGTPATPAQPAAMSGPVPLSGALGSAHRVMAAEATPADRFSTSLKESGGDPLALERALGQFVGGGAPAGRNGFSEDSRLVRIT